MEQLVTEDTWRSACFKAFDLMRDQPAEGRRIAAEMAAEARASRSPLPGSYAELLFAFADFFEGDLPAAEPEFERTAAMFELLGDQQGIAFALLGTVAVWRRHGRNEQAYSLGHARILPILPAAPHHLNVLVLNIMGVLSQELGFTDEAVNHLHLALDQARQLNIPNRVSQILANLGEIFYISGNPEYAETLLIEASQIAVHSSEKWLAPFISTMLALCKLALDKYEDAYCAVAAYALDEQKSHHTDDTSKAFCYSVAAYTLAKRGQLTEAGRLSSTAMLLMNSFEDKHLKPYTWWVSGHLHRCHRHYAEAIRDLRLAVEAAGDKGYVYTPLQALKELAEIYAELGEWEQAYREQQRYIELSTIAHIRSNRIHNEIGSLAASREVGQPYRRRAEDGRAERRIWDDELLRLLSERVI